MNLDEDAAISYEPDEAHDGIESALIQAEQLLSVLKGVNGVGMTKTTTGEDAIVAYVGSRQALSELPASIQGFPVIGEITGEIRAQ